MNRIFAGIRVWLWIGLLLTMVATGCVGGSTPVDPTASTPELEQQPPTQGAESLMSADPQHLLIPRWFLVDLAVDGTSVEIVPGQQVVTIQFQDDGKVNGTGGCNDFSATYTATPDGSMAFGPIASTKMACDPGMQLEMLYFDALSKVERFSTEDLLVLSSADGNTRLTFQMPPK